MKRSVCLAVSVTLLVALALATFVSCGKTHSSGVGAGSKPALQTDGTTSRAGFEPAPTIPLADVLAQIDAYPVPKGVSAQTWTTLTAELKRLLVERDRRGEAVPRPRATHRVAPTAAAKFLSIAPTGLANAVSDLAAVSNPAGTQATLTWTEKLSGDYNNDGVRST